MKKWGIVGTIILVAVTVIAMTVTIGFLVDRNHDLGQNLAVEKQQNVFLSSLLDDRDKEISALETDRRTLQATGLILAWEYRDLELIAGIKEGMGSFVLDISQVKKVFTTPSPVRRIYSPDSVEATIPNIYRWTREPTRGNIASVTFLENGQGTVYGTGVGTTWSTISP